jgi:DNA-directed RNA polymerase subunit RPC12/RpoP
VNLIGLFRRQPKQTTWVHCPNCRFELVKGGEFWGHTIDGWVEYKCANCGRFSDWDFDAPVPLLVSALHDGYQNAQSAGQPTEGGSK